MPKVSHQDCNKCDDHELCFRAPHSSSVAPLNRVLCINCHQSSVYNNERTQNERTETNEDDVTVTESKPKLVGKIHERVRISFDAIV